MVIKILAVVPRGLQRVKIWKMKTYDDIDFEPEDDDDEKEDDSDEDEEAELMREPPPVSVEFISSLFVDDEQSLVLDEQPTLQSCTWWCEMAAVMTNSDLEHHVINVHILMVDGGAPQAMEAAPPTASPLSEAELTTTESN